MTHLLNWGLILAMVVGALGLLQVFKVSKFWSGYLLVLCFLARVAVAIGLSGGLKYIFVVDSLSFEYKGWLLSQPWMSPDLFISLTPGKSGHFNYYEIFLGWVFGIFGNDALIATVLNCLFATITVGVLAVIYHRFFSEKEPSPMPTQILIVMAAIYPSFVVWSATNTRDPLYFCCCALFFLCLMVAFSKKSKSLLPVRLLSILGCLFCFWLVIGLRGYIGTLFLASILLGVVLYGLSRKLSWLTIFVLGTTLTICGLLLYQSLMPASTAKILSFLEDSREAFANLKLLDSVAKSSFGLSHTFNSVTDILTFLPIGLSHYFFGPFPWEVSSLVQVFSLFEAIGIYFLVYPTYRGIRLIYKRSPLETIVVLTFVVSFSISQCLVISNMGTIFRHRTLPFLFLLMFSCEGVYEVAKKNFPTLFKA